MADTQTLKYIDLNDVLVEQWCLATGDTADSVGAVAFCASVAEMFEGVEVGPDASWSATFVMLDRALNVLDALVEHESTPEAHRSMLKDGVIPYLHGRFVEVPVLVHRAMYLYHYKEK
jgi:hypothetical protein